MRTLTIRNARNAFENNIEYKKQLNTAFCRLRQETLLGKLCNHCFLESLKAVKG